MRIVLITTTLTTEQLLLLERDHCCRNGELTDLNSRISKNTREYDMYDDDYDDP